MALEGDGRIGAAGKVALHDHAQAAGAPGSAEDGLYIRRRNRERRAVGRRLPSHAVTGQRARRRLRRSLRKRATHPPPDHARRVQKLRQEDPRLLRQIPRESVGAPPAAELRRGLGQRPRAIHPRRSRHLHQRSPAPLQVQRPHWPIRRLSQPRVRPRKPQHRVQPLPRRQRRPEQRRLLPVPVRKGVLQLGDRTRLAVLTGA